MTSVTTDDPHARAAALRSKRAGRWLCGFLIVLLLLTHVPRPYSHRGEPEHWDKLVHFGLYATLGFLALRALTLWAISSRAWTRCAAVLVCVMAFGLLDETTQPLTGRDFEWLDWLADGTGAFSGILCCEMLRRWRRSGASPRRDA